MTAAEATPQEELLACLRGLRGCVLLRNHDVGASIARGGDVDILAADPPDAESRLVQSMGRPVWSAYRSYVRSHFYTWGHVDILTSNEWRGAIYLPTRDVLSAAATSEFGLLKPRIAHEALISWFASLLWGGFFKSRYRDTIIDAARCDGEVFQEILRNAAGDKWGARLWAAAAEGTPEQSEAWAKRVRRAVWWRALRRAPFRTLRGWLQFWKCEIDLRTRPPLPWIAVLGPDGSGKSTTLNALRAARHHAFQRIAILHWSPGMFQRRRVHGGPVTDPHGKPPRGLLASLAKVQLLWLDWVVGYWFRLVHQRAKGTLLCSDRHFIDLLVDPRRYRYGGPMWIAKAVNWLMPQPDIWFLIDGPTDLLQSRKQEVSPQETERQRHAYKRLLDGRKNTHVLNASAPVEELVAEITTIIAKNLNERPRI